MRLSLIYEHIVKPDRHHDDDDGDDVHAIDDDDNGILTYLLSRLC